MSKKYHKGFLKGYYGYQNLGDELLLLGVIEYLHERYGITDFTVEVGNKKFAEKRHKNNQELIKNRKVDVHFVQIKGRLDRHGLLFSPKVLKVFGGGEVFALREGLFKSKLQLFIYGGWFVILKYFVDVLLRNYVIIGGVETPKHWRQKLIIGPLLRRSKEVIVRDKTSYKTAKKFRSKATLYEDFAAPLIKKLYNEKKITKEDYILLNLHPKVANKQSIIRIKEFVAQYPKKKLIYVAAGEEDKKLLKKLQDNIKRPIENYERENKSAKEIVSFFANATAGIGARLHFLMILKETKTPLEAIVYAEKVQKLILD